MNYPTFLQNPRDPPNIHRKSNNKCNLKILRDDEQQNGFKYLVRDESLGIAFVDNELYKDILTKEINDILTKISYNCDPWTIKQMSKNLVYKYQSLLFDQNQLPNESLVILIDDVEKAKTWHFIFNPLYKAHKFKQESPNGPLIHAPKIRPVISGLQSPTAPLVRFNSHSCNILIVAFENEYNIYNVMTDSYRTISSFDEYLTTTHHPTDKIYKSDYASYTPNYLRNVFKMD